MMIEDGKGSGKKAEVTTRNKLSVYAVTESEEHDANETGRAYSIPFSATPTGTDDCFFYFKNTGEKDVIFEGIGVKLVADEYIDIKIKDIGTPSGGSATTPVNLNAGSGGTLSATVQDGNNITALSGGSTAYRIYHASANETKYTNFEQDIIVTKNQTLTLYIQTGTTALEGFLNCYEHD